MNWTQYFEHRTRPDGYGFICLSDDAPEALRDLVRAIHFDFFGSCMPNDWIYATISHAFDDLADNLLDNCSIEADCYFSDLYRWFGEPFANQICSECAEELGTGADLTMMQQIANGQWFAKDKIYHAVEEWLTEQDNNAPENE